MGASASYAGAMGARASSAAGATYAVTASVQVSFVEGPSSAADPRTSFASDAGARASSSVAVSTAAAIWAQAPPPPWAHRHDLRH